jgi:hypothetical protein
LNNKIKYRKIILLKTTMQKLKTDQIEKDN